MKLTKKIFVFAVIFLMLSSYGTSISLNDNIHLKNNELTKLLEGSNLEVYDGFKILYVNGSHYQMGYQHGFLLKDEVQENVRAFIDKINREASYQEYLDIWNKTKPYIPNIYIEEMQGISDGAEISLEDLAVSYMHPLFVDMQCFSFAAYKNATIDNRLYQIRSLDFSLLIKDPVTKKYTQENSLIIVRNPEDGYKSIIPSTAGWLNFYEGINENQITIGVQLCWSDDNTLKGIPVFLRVQKALDHTSNISDTIDVLTSNKTLGWNFIVSDGKTKEAYAVETSANHSYVGSWDNIIEDKSPFWQIKEVVRRTNFFIDPTLAETQREKYDPSGLIGFLRFFAGNNFFYLLWRKYVSMSNEIEKNWGKIDINTSMSLLRKVYYGRTDILLFIFLNINKEGILCDYHQWAVCTETGEFAISFADANSHSHKTKLYYFNINDFFER